MSRPIVISGLVSAVLLSIFGQAQSSSLSVSDTLALESPGPQASGQVLQQEQASASLRAAGQTVSLTEPVLTVHGICTSSGEKTDAKACTTVVTRQEFDELMKIVAPGKKGDSSIRQNVATMYAELLAFETAARKAGIPDTPEFRWTLQVLRLRTLADSYRRDLEKQYGASSSEEIDGYYQREGRRFEEVKLRRIVLPKNNFSAANKEEFEKKALQVANELRQRAATGEDFDALQRDGYTRLGFPGSPPATEVGSRRRAGLLSQVADEVFALDPGQVSKVENEPYSFVIYKVEARRTLPLQMVRDEISRELSRQKVENALKAVTGNIHTDLNEDYFGTSAGQAHSSEPAARAPQ